VLIVGVDNVGSLQMQKVRIALRGKAVMMMGKNVSRRAYSSPAPNAVLTVVGCRRVPLDPDAHDHPREDGGEPETRGSAPVRAW
jgi:hypothetical protein